MAQLNTGDNIAAIRLANGAASNITTKKGMMRPDARDIVNNAGGTPADPYYGHYPWVTPPPEAITINRRATIPAPAYATQTLVAVFQVPQAMQAVITSIMCSFDGAGFIQGSGAVTWSIDINRPLGAGGATLGYSPPDFSIILTQLGSLTMGPWPVPGGIRLSERDTIRFKVTTVAPVGIGSPNLITCMFLGWYWPSRLSFAPKGS